MRWWREGDEENVMKDNEGRREGRTREGQKDQGGRNMRWRKNVRAK